MDLSEIVSDNRFVGTTETWASIENFSEVFFPSNDTLQNISRPLDNSATDWGNIGLVWVQMAWTFVFSLMIFTATVGNCIVIWIVVAHRRMRTVTNYFLVNLSTADLLLITLNCTFNFIYMIQRNWPFGSWYCTVSNFIANVTVAASVFTLTGISCDRYLAIVYPLHHKMTKVSSLVTIGFIWTASMIFAFPCLLYSTTVTHRYKGGIRTGCIMIWPDKKLVGSQYDLWYQMFFLIVTYVVPMILMSLCYTMMGRVLWGSKSIGEKTQRQMSSIRSKRKVVKMFILVVLIFGLCWLPYHGYFIYVYYDTEIIFHKYTQHIYLSFYWFAMSNAMFNPLIYYWMNNRFRQYFKTAIYGWHVKRFFKRRKGKLNSSNRDIYSKSGVDDPYPDVKKSKLASNRRFQINTENNHNYLINTTNSHRLNRCSTRTSKLSMKKDMKTTDL